MEDILGILVIWPPAWIAIVATICSIIYFSRRPALGRKIFIGSLILIVIGILDGTGRLFGGSLAQLMLMSIICAGGLGLIPFYIGAWIIGSIIVSVIPGAGGAAVASASVSAERNKNALSTYVFQAKSVGKSDAEIKEKMRQQGWSDQDIKAALK